MIISALRLCLLVPQCFCMFFSRRFCFNRSLSHLLIEFLIGVTSGSLFFGGV